MLPEAAVIYSDYMSLYASDISSITAVMFPPFATQTVHPNNA